MSQRAMSVQDMEKSLANKARDHRSVSFNGVSVMVDTALKWSMIPKEQQSQLSAAIDQNKIEVIRFGIYGVFNRDIYLMKSF